MEARKGNEKIEYNQNPTKLALAPILSANNVPALTGAPKIGTHDTTKSSEDSMLPRIVSFDNDITKSSNGHHAKWEENFKLLVEYKQVYNTTRVPRNNPKLGWWVQEQRKKYSQGKLSQYRERRLNSLEFEWKIHVCVPWMDMYKQLVSYREKHDGSTNVPQTSKEYSKLGLWVRRQRFFYCKGKLSSERINLLNSIDFQWKLIETTPWMEMYRRLEAYKAQHKNTRVPRKYQADPKLGFWVNKQRHSCKEQDRIELLNKLGFEWNIQNDWGIMYKRLLSYKKKHGHTRVPYNYTADIQLGHWVRRQRQSCKEQHRIILLNDIGFEWNAQNDWVMMYRRLLMFKMKHGTTCVPLCDDKADHKLAGWVAMQRQQCTDQIRIDLLNAIGFVWN